MMTKEKETYPIVQDYLKKLELAMATKNVDTRKRAKTQANRLLAIMTAKAARQAIELEGELARHELELKGLKS